MPLPNRPWIKDGITRIVNGLEEDPSQSRKDAKKITEATGFDVSSV